MTTIGALLADATARFTAAGVASPRLDARLLIGHALGLTAQQVFMYPERAVSADDMARAEQVIARRELREPVSHILGHREFWSLSFAVSPDTLDPRPDTEALVQAVLDGCPDRNASLALLDFGTGTGCILLALLSELPRARGVGIDAAAGAVALAGSNAQALGLSSRAEFRLGDWGNGLDGCFDVIVSNPPYIPDEEIGGLEPEVARYEPGSALAGGPDGLDCYRRLAGDVARLLAPGGLAGFEVGAGQAADVQAILSDAGLVESWTVSDLAGVERCVMARRRR